MIVDVQEKLVPLVENSAIVRANCLRLVQTAQLLNVPVFGTEQYPKRLGPFVEELAEVVPRRWAKTTFHCLAVPELLEQIHGRTIEHLVVAGIETHVCILQTVLESLKKGLRVQVPADAASARFPLDHEFALRRMEFAGAVVSSTESVMFEWIETSDHPKFKELSALVKNFHPEEKFGF